MAVDRRFDIRQSSGRLTVVLGTLGVLAVLFYLFVVQPTVREYDRLVRASQPRFEALEARRQEVEGQEQFVTAIRQAETDLARLRTEVLGTRGERMVDVQLELLHLAEQFGIDLDTVSYENSLLPGEGLDRLEMVVPLEGGYASLRRFLQAIENSEKFLVVERVGLAEGKDGGTLLELNITLATYFAAAPELFAEAGR